MFGEGVINDAVAILLFKAVEKVISEQTEADSGKMLAWKDIGFMTFNFCYLSSSSFTVGLAFGVATCLTLKHLPGMKESPVREISILLLFGYLSYMLSEILELSSILSLFVCAFVQAQYAF